MLSRDYLLAKVAQFFEAIAKAKKALENDQFEEVRFVLTEHLNRAAIKEFLNAEKPLTDEEYQYFLFQAELLLIELELKKKTNKAYDIERTTYLNFAEKLLKADQKNFNFKLHQQIQSLLKIS